MENLLPVVSRDVGFAIAKDMCDDDEKYVTEEMLKIQEENPVIASFIARWIKKDKKKTDQLYAAFCGILVYKMLRSQAEADKMNEEFNYE